MLFKNFLKHISSKYAIPALLCLPYNMENIFPEGSAVFAKVNPALKLVVRRYVKCIYYCTIQANPSQKELVYFERELMGETTSLHQ